MEKKESENSLSGIEEMLRQCLAEEHLELPEMKKPEDSLIFFLLAGKSDFRIPGKFHYYFV